MPRFGGVRKSKTDAVRVRNRMNKGGDNTKIRRYSIGKVKAGWVVYRRRVR